MAVDQEQGQPGDDHTGDWWDNVAYDPEHKLVLAVVPGARVGECAEEAVEEVKERLGDRTPGLFTSEEHAAYESAIVTAFSQAEPEPATPRRRGRRRVRPRRRLAAGLAYATVRKERKQGRVVSIRRSIVLGDEQAVAEVLKASVCSRTINTSFVERQHGTARGQNARQSRRTYRFSKDWEVHESMSYFTRYRYNFCWPVRTLRVRGAAGRWQQRTPAMSAGLSDHIWSLKEWLSFPVIQRK